MLQAATRSHIPAKNLGVATQTPLHLVGHEVRKVQVNDDALPALQGGGQARTLVPVLCLAILREKPTE